MENKPLLFHVMLFLVNIMENMPKFKPDLKLRLMDQVRRVNNNHNYSYRTGQTYYDWIIRFIRFHGHQNHPE